MTSDQRYIRALVAAVEDLGDKVEQMGCTCTTLEDRNKLHGAPGRRRRDSRCTGVATSVKYRNLLKRARRHLAGFHRQPGTGGR